MNSIKSLLIVTTVVAVLAAGGSLVRQRQSSQAATESFERKKALMDEYFINSLVNDTNLVGAKIEDFPDIAATADYVAWNSDFRSAAILPQGLELRTPASRETSQFDDLFEEQDGGLIPRLTKSDGVYGFNTRSRNRGTLEGRCDIGFFVFARDGNTVAIVDGFSYNPY